MAYVYRYTDLEDLLTKYVGIVYGETRTLQQRLNEHKNNDAWCKNKNWRIEYFYVNTRTDAECLEAHFIALYKTYNYYNTLKKEWGICSFLPIGIQWNIYSEDFSEMDKLKTENKTLKETNNYLLKKVKQLKYDLKEQNRQLKYARKNMQYNIDDKKVDEICNKIEEENEDRKKDCKKKGHPFTISDNDVELIFKLRDRGKSIREIARSVDISVGSVHRYLNMFAS